MSRIIDKFLLKGKTALVTGGGSGIGYSISQILAEAGATVMIAARNRERLKNAAAELTVKTENAIHYAVCDLSDRIECQKLIKHAQEVLGGVDILVGNAGMEDMQFIEDITDESYDKVIEVNLSSNIFMTRAVVSEMKRKGWGRIIYVTSTTTMMASKHIGHSVYSTAKSALHGFTKVAAVEFGMSGITVNSLAPGLVMTQMVTDTIKTSGMNKYEAEAFIKYNASVTGQNRWADPEEIAGPLLLLASDAGSYITGSIFVVDGGQTAVMDPVVRI